MKSYLFILQDVFACLIDLFKLKVNKKQVLLGFLFFPAIKPTSTNNSRYVELLGTLSLCIFIYFKLLTKQVQLIAKAKGYENLLAMPEQYSFFSVSIFMTISNKRTNLEM